MGFVDHEQRPAPGAHVEEIVEGRDVAVHREHGLGDDHRACRVGLEEKLVDVRRVAVPVHREWCLREATPVDERRVVQLVGHHEHVRARERREHAQVGREPGGEQHRVVGVLPLGERGFELGVHGARAHDEARRARSRTPAVDRVMGRPDDRGMLGEAQVVVGRERHHRPAIRGELALGARGVEITGRAIAPRRGRVPPRRPPNPASWSSR